MKQGTEVTKSAFTSQRRSNVRWLMLSEDGNELCWGASRKGKKKRVRVRTQVLRAFGWQCLTPLVCAGCGYLTSEFRPPL